jgi:hypothetical protein
LSPRRNPNANIAILALHQQDFVARLHARGIAVRSVGVDALLFSVCLRIVVVGRRREHGVGVARLLGRADDALERIPRRFLSAGAAIGRRLAVDRVDIPDFPYRAGLGAAGVNLGRAGAAAGRDGKAKNGG